MTFHLPIKVKLIPKENYRLLKMSDKEEEDFSSEVEESEESSEEEDSDDATLSDILRSDSDEEDETSSSEESDDSGKKPPPLPPKPAPKAKVTLNIMKPKAPVPSPPPKIPTPPAPKEPTPKPSLPRPVVPRDVVPKVPTPKPPTPTPLIPRDAVPRDAVPKVPTPPAKKAPTIPALEAKGKMMDQLLLQQRPHGPVNLLVKAPDESPSTFEARRRISVVIAGLTDLGLSIEASNMAAYLLVRKGTYNCSYSDEVENVLKRIEERVR
jgi:hypothetical protein